MKLHNKKKVSPEYPRIPHLMGKSNLYDDDIEINVTFGFDAYVQEKVDGANCGISWLDGPILRNRKHVLRKGFERDTPAKKQFVPAWNWLHEKEDDLKEIMNRWQGQVTVYGEWMFAKHSIGYEKLPDYFLAYDVWSCDENKFISPNVCRELFKGTGIEWIEAEKLNIQSFGDLKSILDSVSKYRDGVKEGIVIKRPDATDKWIDETFKVVRSDFERADDTWNKKGIEKNKIIK